MIHANTPPHVPPSSHLASSPPPPISLQHDSCVIHGIAVWERLQLLLHARFSHGSGCSSRATMAYRGDGTPLRTSGDCSVMVDPNNGEAEPPLLPSPRMLSLRPYPKLPRAWREPACRRSPSAVRSARRPTPLQGGGHKQGPLSLDFDQFQGVENLKDTLRAHGYEVQEVGSTPRLPPHSPWVGNVVVEPRGPGRQEETGRAAAGGLGIFAEWRNGRVGAAGNAGVIRDEDRQPVLAAPLPFRVGWGSWRSSARGNGRDRQRNEVTGMSWFLRHGPYEARGEGVVETE